MKIPLGNILVVWFFLGLTGCQKELDEGNLGNCILQRVEIYEGASASPAEIYDFEYDQFSTWPLSVNIQIPFNSYNETIPISVQDRTIEFGVFGSLELDGSRRITELIVETEFPGALKGDYFYGYNSQGFLQDRLFDDGINDFELTNFQNNGISLTGFETIVTPPDPVALGTLSYFSSPNIGGDLLLPLTDIMPELLPFAPLIRIGNLGNIPPEQYTLLLPTLGGLTVQYHYSNYTLDNNRLTGFDQVLEIPGLPPVTRRYRFGYLCR